MNDRQNKIIDLIKEKNFISVQELINILHYSGATIRRDLNVLEKRNLIRRTRGGALNIQTIYQEAPLNYKFSVNLDLKKRIGSLASKLVTNYQSIFLDGSSTCSELARHIVQLEKLDVFTSNLDIAIHLSRNSDDNVFILPGKLNDVNAHGIATIHEVQKYVYDVAFISCRGLTASLGITDRSEDDALLKKKLKKNAKKLILLIDHTKFSQIFTFPSLKIADFDYIVSDQQPPKDLLDEMNEKKVKVIYPN